MMGNANLRRASKNKKDEFYTQYKDIHKEVQNYFSQLKNKTVYCNTDSIDSNFTKYFLDNFEKFGLESLIISDISGSATIFKNSSVINLKIDGDFRSADSIELLKKSDVVCTNPPFSLFREFIDLMSKYKKDFLIIGNNNALTYKNVFELIKSGVLRTGFNYNKTIEFLMPDSYEKWGRKDKSGNKYGKVPAISWFTTLEVRGKPAFTPTKIYYGNEDKYPKYDNYDAIEVNRVTNIPKDYEGFMGVPITFVNQYDPNKFNILGIMNTGEENKGIRLPNTKHGRPVINGTEKYLRYIIKNKNVIE